MISEISFSDLKDEPFNLAFCPNSPSAKYISTSLEAILSSLRLIITKFELYLFLSLSKKSIFDLNNLSIKLSLKPFSLIHCQNYQLYELYSWMI